MNKNFFKLNVSSTLLPTTNGILLNVVWFIYRYFYSFRKKGLKMDNLLKLGFSSDRSYHIHNKKRGELIGIICHFLQNHSTNQFEIENQNK
jgi:hypothetical protein